MADLAIAGLHVYGDAIIDGPGTAPGSVITRTILDEIAEQIRDRATHTGTQLFETISDGRTYVDSRFEALIGTAPANLDTLQEIAGRFADDADAAAAMTASIAANRTDLDATTGRVVTLETSFGTLRGEYDATTGEVTNLRADLTTATATANGAAADAATLRTDVNTLRTDVDALTGTAGGLASQADLDTAVTRIDGLGTRLDGVDTTTGTLRTDVDAAAATAAAAQTAADAAAATANAAAPAATVATLTGRVDQLRTDVDTVTATANAAATATSVTDLTARVDTLRTDADTLRTDLDTLGTNGGAATAAVAADVAALTTRVDGIADDLAALGTDLRGRLDAVEARVTVLERVSVFARDLGNGAVSTFTVAHGLGTRDVDVIVRTADGQRFLAVDTVVDENTVTVDTGSYVPAANALRVLVKAYPVPTV